MNSKKDRISNSFAEYWIEDGIIFGSYKNGALIDLDAAKDCLRIRRQIQGDKPMPILLDISGLKELTKSARLFLSSPEVLKDSTAGALVTNQSVFVRTIGNIYFSLSRPPIPHKMFSDKDQAVAWLKQYI